MHPYTLANSSIGKSISLGIGALFSFFVPIQVLLIVAFVFIAVDFVVGLVVSIRIRKQGLLSSRIWDTVYKLVGAQVCIVLAWLLDAHVATFAPLHLANVFTGIICGADLWSILSNFATLSNHPAFRLIQKWGKSEIEKKTEGLNDFDK
ncbi:MAG: phage holin family protein, partial [Bacteroidales bacterium]